MSKVRMIRDMVMVKPILDPLTTKTGLILAESVEQKPCRGTVISCGPGFRMKSGTLMPMPIKPGDIVAFSHEAGADLEHEGETFRVMREGDCSALVL